MSARPSRVPRCSAGALAGATDALIELPCRRLGLRAKIAVEHRFERLVVADGEGVIAGLVMRAHQKAMRFLVVGLELQEFLQRPDGRLRVPPFELERRKVLRRSPELTIRLFALPIDPRPGSVREKFSAMHGDRGPQILDRLARPS